MQEMRWLKSCFYSHLLSEVEGSLPDVLPLLFLCTVFFHPLSVVIGTAVWFHNRVPLGPDTLKLCCCTTYLYIHLARIVGMECRRGVGSTSVSEGREVLGGAFREVVRGPFEK